MNSSNQCKSLLLQVSLLRFLGIIRIVLALLVPCRVLLKNSRAILNYLEHFLCSFHSEKLYF